ncbi:unnamed protein product [Sphenostylis stenocarpa]|uniref:Uncharacterized protein n=1 Tax=Sphenostylis stenocarpa TaxID=92480 RepID=A0AA86S8C9_9FABA|nr:unnamed protein product [Sphenostylis stenocarpa]
MARVRRWVKNEKMRDGKMQWRVTKSRLFGFYALAWKGMIYVKIIIAICSIDYLIVINKALATRTSVMRFDAHPSQDQLAA